MSSDEFDESAQITKRLSDREFLELKAQQSALLRQQTRPFSPYKPEKYILKDLKPAKPKIEVSYIKNILANAGIDLSKTVTLKYESYDKTFNTDPKPIEMLKKHIKIIPDSPQTSKTLTSVDFKKKGLENLKKTHKNPNKQNKSPKTTERSELYKNKSISASKIHKFHDNFFKNESDSNENFNNQLNKNLYKDLQEDSKDFDDYENKNRKNSHKNKADFKEFSKPKIAREASMDILELEKNRNSRCFNKGFNDGFASDSQSLSVEPDDFMEAKRKYSGSDNNFKNIFGKSGMNLNDFDDNTNTKLTSGFDLSFNTGLANLCSGNFVTQKKEDEDDQENELENDEESEEEADEDNEIDNEDENEDDQEEDAEGNDEKINESGDNNDDDKEEKEEEKMKQKVKVMGKKNKDRMIAAEFIDDEAEQSGSDVSLGTEGNDSDVGSLEEFIHIDEEDSNSKNSQVLKVHLNEIIEKDQMEMELIKDLHIPKKRLNLAPLSSMESDEESLKPLNMISPVSISNKCFNRQLV